MKFLEQNSVKVVHSCFFYKTFLQKIYQFFRCQEDFRFIFQHFQIVFEGVWGNSRVSGYMAVDDVTFFEGACSSEYWKIYFPPLNFSVSRLFDYNILNSVKKKPKTLNIVTRKIQSGNTEFSIEWWRLWKRLIRSLCISLFIQV